MTSEHLPGLGDDQMTEGVAYLAVHGIPHDEGRAQLQELPDVHLALEACLERRPGAKRKADREDVRQETVGEGSVPGQSASPQQAVPEGKRRRRGT